MDPTMLASMLPTALNLLSGSKQAEMQKSMFGAGENIEATEAFKQYEDRMNSPFFLEAFASILKLMQEAFMTALDTVPGSSEDKRIKRIQEQINDLLLYFFDPYYGPNYNKNEIFFAGTIGPGQSDGPSGTYGWDRIEEKIERRSRLNDKFIEHIARAIKEVAEEKTSGVLTQEVKDYLLGR